MIRIERIKFKYNKGREGLREVTDLLASLCTKTRPHDAMSCHRPSDASEMTLYEKALQMHIVTLTELTGRYCVRKYTRRVEDSLRRFPVGGVIFYDRSLKTAPQVLALTSAMKRFYREQTGLELFVCVFDSSFGIIILISLSLI